MNQKRYFIPKALLLTAIALSLVTVATLTADEPEAKQNQTTPANAGQPDAFTPTPKEQLFDPFGNGSSSIAKPQTKTGDSSKLASPEPLAAFRGKKTIAEKLDTDFDVNFRETPLKDVVSLIQDQTGVRIYLNVKKMEEAAVSPDVPITVKFTGLTLRSVLQLILDELELASVDFGRHLMITTLEDADSHLQVRVYDCRDLIAFAASDGAKPAAGTGSRIPSLEVPSSEAPKSTSPSSGTVAPGGIFPQFGGQIPLDNRDAREIAADRLREIILSTVESQSWDNNGGPATIAEFNGLLVVSHTDSIHEKVEHLLNMLHKAAGLGEGGVKVTR